MKALTVVETGTLLLIALVFYAAMVWSDLCFGDGLGPGAWCKVRPVAERSFIDGGLEFCWGPCE